MLKYRFAGCLLAATVLTPVTGYAQSAPNGTTASDQGATLEEVIVTAQRREERLKDVPITVTAVTGNQLQQAGVSGSLALTTITPGLNFVVQGAYAQPTIRGIGTSVTGAGADANVAMYVDGVYQPSQVGNVFDFNNVERIEVLKGPQGTLFGRNATGGAVTVTTLTPSFDAHGQIGVGYGSFNEYKVNTYITGALGPNVAADLAVLYKHDDGYIRNITLNKDTAKGEAFGARSKILWNATDRLSFVLAGVIARNSNNAIYLTRPINHNNAALRTDPTLYFPSSRDEINTDTDPVAKNSTKSLALTGKYRWDAGTLTSITAYQKLGARLLVDSDVTSIPNSSNLTTLPEKTFSQEVNYASTLDGPLNFTAGVYYYRDNSLRHTVNSKGVDGPVSQDFTVRVKTLASAVYGEVYYDVTPALRLIGGVRYSTERKHAYGTYAVGSSTVLDSEKSWNATTPRASVIYKLDDASNVYASYSKGFKSGSYNTTTLNNPVPVDPEFVNAYEVGYKHAGGRLIANLSAFYYDYQDIQVAVQTNAGGVSTGVLQNAANAKIYGVDGDLTAILTDHWRIRLGAAYTDAKYEDFTNALLTTPRAGGGNTQAPGDASDKDMIRSPDLMANATLTYNTDLSYGHVEASLTASYNSGFYWDPGNRVEQPAYTLLNANVAWSSPDDKYKVQLWGTNLTDEDYYYYVSVSTTGDSGSHQRPRAFGISLTRYFD